MGTVIGAVDLFGGKRAVFGGRDGRWTEVWFDNIDPAEWEKLPEEGVLLSNQYPVRILVRYGHISFFTANNLRELKQEGLTLMWRRANPNGAELQDLQRRKDYHLKRYDEDTQKIEDGEYRVLTFTEDTERGGRSSNRLDQEQRTKFVYVPNHTDITKVQENRPMVCSLNRVGVNHAPTAERPGFKLIVVNVLHEHIHPDELIARLERAIAEGNP